MSNEASILLVRSILTICAILISYVLVPFIKSMYTTEQLDRFTYYVTVAVRCAEQIYTPEQWAEKKAFVVNYCKNILKEFHITLTDDDLNNIIEGIVNEVKH